MAHRASPGWLTAFMHTSPDADCLLAGWLLARFVFPRLFPKQRIVWEFASFATGVTPALIERSVAGVDIGGIYDPRRLLFDHHQFPEPLCRETCAAELVYRYIVEGYEELAPIAPEAVYLEPLVKLVKAGDTGQLDAEGWGLSSRLGLHALINGFRPLERERMLQQLAGDDAERHEETLLTTLDRQAQDFAFSLFDVLASGARRADVARHTWGQHATYASEDGRVLALEGAPFGALSHAFQAGASIVVLTSEERLPHTYALEVWSKREADLDIGALLTRLSQHPDPAVRAGYRRLAAGRIERRFAVSGTPKGPVRTPLPVRAATFAAAIADVWSQEERAA